jgi:type I restriction enzyme, S subunit
MVEWRDVRLGDAIELQRGFDLPSATRRPGFVPVVSSGGATGFHDEARVAGPGVVTGRYGTLGNVFYLTRPFWPLNTTLFVRDFKGNDPRFVSFLLRTVDFLAYSDKAAVPGVNRNHLHEARIRLPPVDTQRKIAGILGALDDKIEANHRLCETLESSGRVVYRRWGERQHDRDFQRLGHACRVLSGGTPSRSNPRLWSGSIPWISPKAMTAIHCDDPDAHVAAEAIGNGTRLAPAGATLVMVRGMGLHEGVRVSQARVDVTFNQDVKALVPNEIEPALLLFAVLDAQKVLHDRVESSGHGTGVLGTDALTNYAIAVPDRATRQSIATGLTSLNDRIAVARDQTRTLTAIRDSLLPRLLDGSLAC